MALVMILNIKLLYSPIKSKNQKDKISNTNLFCKEKAL